jgi:hypothetical protein
VQQAWFEDNGPDLDGIRAEWKVVGFQERHETPPNLLEVYLPGTRLRAITSSGAALRARIASVSVLPEAPDLVAYGVTVHVDGEWEPLCGSDARGHPALAIRLPGIWDHRAGVPGGGDHLQHDEMFTLACEGSTLEKCAELYRPWTSRRAAAAHQTCTRTLRADYCGDGTPHTNFGVTIDIKDRFGRQFRRASASWNNEAMWGEEGAGCVANLREANLVPDCLSRLLKSSCMDPPVFDDRKMLLMTRVPPS